MQQFRQCTMADPGILEPGARSRLGIIFEVEKCFSSSLHIHYTLLVRVKNTKHIVNIAC